MGRGPKGQMRHGPRSTCPPAPYGCPDLCFQTQKGGSIPITVCIQKRVEENRQEAEKKHIYRVDFPWILDAQGTSPTRRRSEETQTWWPLWALASYRVHKEGRRQKLWVMIVTVARSRYRRPLCCTFSLNTWRENGLPNVKMSFTNCAEWTGKQAASRWRQLFALWWAQNFYW